MDLGVPVEQSNIAEHYGGRIDPNPDISSVAAQLNFLEGVAPGDLEHLVGSDASEVRVLDQRHLLFKQDTPLTAIFLVIKGSLYQERVSLQDGKRRLSLRSTLKPGKIAGLYDMLYRLPHSATVRALEPTTVLAIDSTAIGRLLVRYPDLRTKIAPLDKIARLRTIPFFAEQSMTELCFVADACAIEEYPKGKTLYRIDDELDNFYIIDQGQAQLTHPELDDLWLGNGTVLGIGQLDLPPHSPALAAYSAHTTAPTRLFVINRKVLLGIMSVDLARIGFRLRAEINDTIHRLAVFRNYSDGERRKLMGYMNYFSVADKRRLMMQQGEMGDSFWLLMPNRLATVAALNTAGQAIARTKLSGPIYFSESALLVQRALKSTVDAEANSQWLRLHRTDFQVFLKETDPALAQKLVLSDDLNIPVDSNKKKYPWLQDGEIESLFRLRHWIALANRIVLPFFLTLLFLLVAVLSLLFLSFSFLFQLIIFGPIALILLLLWSWFVADYLNDYLIVTNLRVVRQEKTLMVNEQRQSALLNQIQNVDVATNFLGNILGFATVRIQTSGSSGEIIFDRVANADDIKTAIFALRGEQEGSEGVEGKLVIQHVLEERLGVGLEIPHLVRVDADEVLNSEPETSRLGGLLGLSGYESIAVWNASEKVVWHKHWLILVREIAPAAFLFIISLFVLLATIVGTTYLGGSGLPLFRSISEFAGPALIIPAVLLWLGSIAWGGWQWADWRNDTYEIDGKEVTDVEKTPLFTGEKRRSARLGDIENVESKIPSPIHYFFNYGNVVLLTAATDGEFTFDHVPNPRAVAEEIRRRIDKFEREQDEKQARKNAKDLPDWFETYNRLDANRFDEEDMPLSIR